MDRRRGTRQGAGNGAGLGMARSGRHAKRRARRGAGKVAARWGGAASKRSGAGRFGWIDEAKQNRRATGWNGAEQDS